MSQPTINLTTLAKAKLDEYLAEEPSDTVVRILVEGDGKYGLSLDVKVDGDVSFEQEGLQFAVEEEFVSAMDGLRIDYLEQGASSGFALTGSRASPFSKAVVLASEETPNPDARKFVLSFSLPEGPRTWGKGDPAPDPFPEILGLEGVETVFQLADFVTVTRAKGADWDAVEPAATAILNKLQRPQDCAPEAPQPEVATESELQVKLARFLDADVAPWLRRDGGDIELVACEEGVVKVKLRGACGTCPSSVATLHLGVERRLKETFPEVTSLQLVEA